MTLLPYTCSQTDRSHPKCGDPFGYTGAKNVGVYLQQERNVELWEIAPFPLSTPRECSSNKWQNRDCDGDYPNQDKVASQDGVDEVLGQKFEEQEETQQDCTADERKRHCILQIKRVLL